MLLVDDDESVVGAVAELLAARGYTVLKATGSECALESARGGAAVDLLLCDAALTGINWFDLAARLRTLHPRLSVVLMGTSPEPAGRDVVVLDKPFRWDDLQKTITHALALSGSR